MPLIARVEPLTRTRAVRGPFDYRLRPDQAGVAVGSLLRIPFNGRPALGVVVGLASESQLAPDRLAEPEAVLPSGVPPDLVALAEWMADEYCSTPARALTLVLAPGATAGRRHKRALVAELTAAGAQARHGTLAAPPGTRPLTTHQLRTLEMLEARGPTPAAQLGTGGLRRLEARGLVRIEEHTVRRAPARHRIGAADATPPELTGAQARALAEVLDALRTPGARPRGLLLHGVTGSGKTEVYLRAVSAALQAGRSAIVLVPEIALTPQALHRFQTRLGDVVAVLHSGMSDGERHDEWHRLASGEARVAVGPRSAVFAPLRELGLVIVDEEHEGSYKHEGDPRYDARAVAQKRAEDHGALLLLGTATPRPESVRACTRVRLPERIDRRPLPPVEVLDMRGHSHPLHPATHHALAELRRAEGKAIVLLNRRGWSNFLSCRSCGHVWMCPNCDVALVLHRGGGVVACHHCGHRERVPTRCGSCGSVSVARHGAGTERIERELADALGGPGFPVIRLDADATGIDERAALLERFQSARAGVLVGTQMVAKGHDFPDVALGIVLDADQTLRFPDFRAEERTFALITQLAGRAGRGKQPGRVLVQTLAPDARSIRFAQYHDADGFINDELARRELLGYPPFSSLIRVVCAAEDGDGPNAIAAALGSRASAPGATILGPAPLFRLRNRARSQIVIKAGDRAAAIASLRAAIDAVAKDAVKRRVSISVDVDPQ